MKRACVIGWPVSHSRSPLIHGYWLQRYGIDGSYVRRRSSRTTSPIFCARCASRALPAATSRCPTRRRPSLRQPRARPAARNAGAANTLWFEADRLVADNTDSAGFMNSLSAAQPALQIGGATVSVLGAGGAARGIVFALLERGAGEVRVFNRTRDRADALAPHFGARVKAHDWRDRVDRSRDVALLVNATSLGMNGGGALDMDVSALDPRLRRRRHRLRAAGDAAAGCGARARASPPSTASACCCTRRCRASRSGSACAPRLPTSCAP